MSKKVTVDFEGISISIQSKCQIAANSLCKIDKVLERISKTASKLETKQIKDYEMYLLDSKNIINNKIMYFMQTLEKYKNLKQQILDIDIVYSSNIDVNLINKYNYLTSTLKEEGENLINTVNELTGSKLAIIDQMITDELLNLNTKVNEKLMNKAYGVLNVNQEILVKINKIEDVSLRQLAYKEAVKEENSNISYEEIFKKAQTEYNILLCKKTNSVIQEYKEELKKKGIPSDIIDNSRSIDEATKIVTKAIDDESIRKETIKIILKAIRQRGFIVNKENIKIDREKNIVKLVALKISGQIAEFEIHINGKFMYHFEGYEGMACNKDINSFIEDLKNVYDINILHQEIEWSNPDKMQTQKYQYVKENKGKN